jgi:hypothetical protein
MATSQPRSRDFPQPYSAQRLSLIDQPMPGCSLRIHWSHAWIGLGLILAGGGCRLVQQRHEEVVAVNIAERQASSHALVAKGIEYVEKNHFPKAQRCFEQAIAIDGENGIAHNNLGLVHYYQHNFLDAATEFEIAVDQLPNDPAPLNNLGLIMEMAARPDEALEYYARANQLAPTNPEYLGNLARAKVRMKLFDDELQNQLHALLLFDRRLEWQDWAREQLGLFHNPLHDRGPPKPSGDPLGGAPPSRETVLTPGQGSDSSSRRSNTLSPGKSPALPAETDLRLPSAPDGSPPNPLPPLPSPLPLPIPEPDLKGALNGSDLERLE